MRKLIPPLFLLALSIGATAAPKTTSKPALKLAIDPAVMALLDKSAASYAKLRGLSMRINGISRRGEKVTPLSGNLLFSRPNLAKLTLKFGDQQRLYLSDGQITRTQDSPQGFRIRAHPADAIQAIFSNNPLAMNFILSQLIGGTNPLRGRNAGWKEVHFLGLSRHAISLTLELKPPGKNPTPPVWRVVHQL